MISFASAIALGGLIALVAAFWFDYFANESMEVIAFSLSVCLAGSCVLSWFLLGMSLDRFVAGYVLAIVLSGFLLEMALESRGNGGSAREREDDARSSFNSAAVLLVAIFLLCFAAMLSLTYTGTQLWHDNEIWLVVLPAALIVCLAALFLNKFETGVLLYIALILAVAGALLSAFFSVDPLILFVIATNELTITASLSILIMSGLAKGSSRAPHEVGALLVVVMFVGCICGRLCGELTISFGGSSVRGIVSIAVVIALIVAVSAALSSRPLAGVVRYRFRKTEKRAEDQQKSEEENLKAFAAEKGLGAREYETLCLLAEGCSAREVAEKMFIANGTAKEHIRHVYQKLEVSDRDTLLDVVKRARDPK